jgi:hypothetical protein
MMTDPASAIKREVLHLVELQIETLRQDAQLTGSDLERYRARSGEISSLPRTRSNWKNALRFAIRQGVVGSPWFEGARPPPAA